MATLKERIFAICTEVAAEFEGWKFTAGTFKNSDLKHTSLVISPSFAFRHFTAVLQPTMHVCNKRSMRLYKESVGRSTPTSLLHYAKIADFSGAFKDQWKQALVRRSANVRNLVFDELAYLGAPAKAWQRTDFGLPQASIRLRMATPIAASVC